jgi:hypothetical protein
MAVLVLATLAALLDGVGLVRTKVRRKRDRRRRPGRGSTSGSSWPSWDGCRPRWRSRCGRASGWRPRPGPKDEGSVSAPRWRTSIFGYGLTTVLALAFLALGALMMHGSGTDVRTLQSRLRAPTHRRLPTLSRADGPVRWCRPLPSPPCSRPRLTVFDAFPRSLARATALIRRRGTEHRGSILAWSVFVAGGAVTIIGVFAARFTALIDFVTMLAFLTAPVFAGLNLALIRSRHTPPAARPPAFLVGLAIAGLVFFLGFAGLYAVSRIAPGMPS